MKTFLTLLPAYPWTEENGFFFRGYVIAGEKCLRGHDAISFLRGLLFQREVMDVLHSLDGMFSMIWKRTNDVLFAADRLRSLPLFYSVVNGELWVGNDAEALVRELPEKTLSSLSEAELLTNLTFISGSHTLIEELSQVQAGEFCVFDPHTAQMTRRNYYRFQYGEFYSETDMASMLADFHKAYDGAGKEMVEVLAGRTAVIPLSGGADSRMVLSMLIAQGYDKDKILCFTYGSPGNPDSEISRKVAEAYGCPWVMVPYSKELWESLRGDPVLIGYEDYAFAYSSTPHLQDYPAVQYLKEHGKLPKDSVFIPGHMGDAIAGSGMALPRGEKTCTQKNSVQFVSSHFYYNMKLTPELTARISESFSKDPIPYEAAVSERLWFDFCERQEKFILNSARCYEYFGYEWLVPLGSRHILDFWAHVPFAMQHGRKLYFQAVGDTLPSTNDSTRKKRVADRLRSIPCVAALCRRTKRGLNYYTETPRCEERLFKVKEYFSLWLRSPSNINLVNALEAQKMVKRAKAELDRYETK